MVEPLILLKQDVLWFQIAMYKVSLVAVVDASQDLLHEDCGVFFCEFSPLDNLFKELSSIAELRYNVVVFVVFKRLEDSQNVRVIKFLQCVDFIPKTVILNLLLFQNLDRSNVL